jgi:hypothetical protein
VVDVERDEGRVAQRSTAGASRVDAPARREDEPVDVLVLAAVVSCVRPAADRLGGVVVAADQAGRVDVEGLSWGVGVDLGREADVEASSALAGLLPRMSIGDRDCVVHEQRRR